MKKNLRPLIVFLLFLSISCSNEETVPVATNYESDQDFYLLVEKISSIMKKSNATFSNLTKEELDDRMKLVNSFNDNRNLRQKDLNKLSKLLNYNSEEQLYQEKEEFENLVARVIRKYPILKDNPQILGDKMDKQFDYLLDPGNNCDGIYSSCVSASATAGAACVIATAGGGTFFCVLAAGAAMEYCRQQRLGCN